MAILWDAPVTPDAATAFVREVPMGANQGLLNLFGRRDLPGDTIDFAEIVRTNRVARYRSWDGRVHVSERDGGSEAQIRILPLSNSLDQGEYERMQRRMAELGGGNRARLADAIYNDAEQLTNEVLNRLELAWGDTLSDGVLSISEGGLTGSAGTIDYGVPADQKTTVGTAHSSVATAPALSDFQTVIDRYVDNNGFAPGFMLTSNAELRNLRRNAEVIDAIYGTTAGRTRVTMAELADLLSSEFQGLTLLDPYDSSLSVDGVSTRTVPADKVMFLPPNLDDLGYTAWGTTVTALEMVNSAKSEMSFENAPGIVGLVVKSEGIPFRETTYVDALAMPVLTDARLLSVLDVTP